jgi:PAS domain S-box-containing protein
VPPSPLVRADHAAVAQRSGVFALAGVATLTLLAACALAAGWRSTAATATLLVLAAATAGLAFVYLGREVVQRRASGRALEGAAARFAGLLDSAMDAIITVDSDQRIVLYNRAAERIFGWPSEQALGERMDKLMPERFRGGHAEQVRRFGTMGTTSRRMGDGTVLYGQRASGEEFPMEASISQLDTADGKLFTVIVRDVTERARAREELSAFASEAHAILESEKTRIARELHDELAQSLTALKMDTIWVRDHLAADLPGASAKLGDMLGMLDTTVAATRRIASDLRPLMLDDLGLVPAIEWLAQNFGHRTGVACTLKMDEEVELHEPYATAVFRIAQESLANIAKHAGASEVEVCIERMPGAVVLQVRDNGRGFVPDAPRKPYSLGLMGLRERTQLLKGRIHIDSQPGRGTCIDVHIPVAEAGAAP